MVAKTLKDKKLSAIEKVDGVRKQAKDLEQRAQRQEKLLEAGQQTGGKVVMYQDELLEDNVEQTMAVNDMYIDAIQAKLKLLDNL